MNRAPRCPPPRFDAWIVPPWRSAIQRAIARPRPVPPLGASGARQNRSNTWSSVRRIDARVPRPRRSATPPARPSPSRDHPPGSGGSRCPRGSPPAGAAAPRRRGRGPARPPARAARRVARPRAPATRSPRPRRCARSVSAIASSTASASVRASSSRSATRCSIRAAPASRSSIARSTVAGSSRPRRSSAIAARVIASGVRSSWLASAANSRWRSQRLADRHQRPAGVHVAHRDGRGEDGEPAAEQDDEQRPERVELRGPVADDERDEPARRRLDGLREDADRRVCRSSSRRSSAGPRRSPPSSAHPDGTPPRAPVPGPRPRCRTASPAPAAGW